uniref:Uncharacterized protein n=1 Tax=Tetranychus urticae TaxID=32264 RepID=T1KTU6_TETUR
MVNQISPFQGYQLCCMQDDFILN